MKKLVLFLLFALGGSSAFAQTTIAEELLLKQVNEEKNYIRQNLNQTSAANGGLTFQQLASNVARVQQEGEQNVAMLQQYGVGNVVNLQQQGSGNSYEGYVSGNYNVSDLYQIGNANRIEQDLQTNNQNYVIRQQGSGNVLTQIEMGSNAKSYSVEQLGNDMKITIVNGGATVPFQ
ncbi:hypothetical protein EFA69_13710 [Rufibacter immobilis]|uniref:Curlin n=1 Tax=Rufibacter immobilis TaxID=1348778 RepID=A0A3M9MNU2_9BACT|nr:hypothetical protein [Rufibacter immobilis]RNI27212.1 hypothetical protein EFA69_13710 [Rufibacter immobilis]